MMPFLLSREARKNYRPLGSETEKRTRKTARKRRKLSPAESMERGLAKVSRELAKASKRFKPTPAAILKIDRIVAESAKSAIARAAARGRTVPGAQGGTKPRHKPGSKFNAGYSKLSITVSPQVRAAIEAMLATGMFGLTLAGVVEEIVRAGVRDAIVRGWARPPAGMRVEGGELVLRTGRRR